MATDANPAIELLLSQIDDLERRVNAFKASVNTLCAHDGRPPIFPPGGGGGAKEAPGSQVDGETAQPVGGPIKSDSFYGLRQQTAARKFLEMRGSAASPREILEGLRAGGYQVEAKTDEVALVGLRAMLRKRTAVFHKLPNQSYGLVGWYEHLPKPAKATDAKADNAEKPASGTDEASASGAGTGSGTAAPDSDETGSAAVA